MVYDVYDDYDGSCLSISRCGFENSVTPHSVQADQCQNGGDRQSCKGAPAAHLGRAHGIDSVRCTDIACRI